MPLGAPPSPRELRRLPARTVSGQRLHRVYRRGRSAWWFAALEPAAPPERGGRFDLPHPNGACYLGTTVIAAVLEALQDYSRGLLADDELRRRQRMVVTAPSDTPPAAYLTASRAAGVGVTAALWAGRDRALTQQWAAELHRAGWRCLYHGIQHDPAGQLRAVTLLDRAGAHLPFDDSRWRHVTLDLHDDDRLTAALRRFGIEVTRSDPQLPVIPLDDAGLV